MTPAKCKKWVLLFLLLNTAGYVHAEQQGNNEVDEEVVVIGTKSSKQILVEFRKVEKDMYALYNSLNEDRRFDVLCENRAETGTRLKKQVCLPRYYYTAETKEAGATLNNFAVTEAEAIAQKDRKAFEEKVQQAIAKDPQLMDMLVKYEELRLEYVQQTNKDPRSE